MNENKPNGINCYLYDDDEFGPVGGGFIGFAELNKDNGPRVHIGGRDLGISVLETNGLEHEVGHYLGLFHTHAGCEDNPLEPPVINDPEECEQTGDYICDTPADLVLTGNVSPNCSWNGTGSSGCVTEIINAGYSLNDYNPDTYNIMSGTYPTCRTHFTDGQFQFMRSYIALDPEDYIHEAIESPSFATTCSCEGNTGDIHINEGEFISIDEDQPIGGNVFVHAGGIFNITAAAAFNDGKGIIVERGGRLIVDGGTLTKCPYASSWDGIYVEGNGQFQKEDPFFDTENGFVEINDSRVEFTNTAIKTYKYGNSNYSQYWGGLVICRNTTFEFVNKAAEFMRYLPINQSKFDNCKFIGDANKLNDVGVSIWNCRDLLFSGNEFTDLGLAGIYSVDGLYQVVGNNRFINNNVGSHATSTFQNFSSNMNIEGNFFSEGYSGVVTSGIQDLQVRSNQFECNVVGVSINGESGFFVEGNTFDWQGFGVDIYSAGDDRNRLECNGYSNIGYSTLVFGSNSNYTFDFENYSSGVNLEIWGTSTNPGEIFPQQRASAFVPLFNEFSAGLYEIRAIPDNTTVEFEYSHPDYDLDSPFIAECDNSNLPSCVVNNYSNIAVPFDGDPLQCEPGKPFQSQAPKCNTPDCLSSYRQSLIDIGALIESEGATIELRSQKYQIEAQLDEAVNGVINEYLQINDYEAIHSFLTIEGSTNKELMKLISIQLQTLQFEDAQSTLESFLPENQNEEEFLFVQSLNLSRLTNSDFELSLEDKNELYSIIDSKGLMSGYAMGVASAIDNEEVFEGEGTKDDDDLPCGGTIGRVVNNTTNSKDVYPSKRDVSDGETIKESKIRPNPSSNEITIDLPTLNSDFKLSIYNLIGQKIWTKNQVSGHLMINVSDWKSGIYILEITSRSTQKELSKFIIQH